MPHAVALVLAGIVLTNGCAPADTPAVDPGAPDASPAAPAPAPATVPAGAPTVAFLGDSITAGLHLARHEAYPAVLARRLAAAGRPFHLVNGGVSGDTTAGGLARVEWLLRQRPDVLVIALGGNDGLRGLPLVSIEDNLRGIVTRARESGVRVLLLGVRLPPNYGPEYTGGFDALFPRLARELDVPFVPYFMEGVGGVPELNLRDGLHPSPAGHERIASNVEASLAAILTNLDPAGGTR